MRILVVAATPQEIPSLHSGPRSAHHVDVLVTGVGMVATAARCAQAMTRTRYDLAFNFGVCGAFDRGLALGAVVHVVHDQFTELGIEDGECFVALDRTGLVETTSIVNSNPPPNDALAALPTVRGITVNTVHGSEATIAAVVNRVAPQIESMEGAAFAYACALCAVPYAQVRAVSNVVERRNRAAWRLDLAIANLAAAAGRILDHA
jgi:futalosine hydrolase